MLGRRSHARVSIESDAEGVLSLTRDISLHATSHDQLVAISRDAGVIGERVRIVIPDQDANVVAEVIESRPIVRDGAVRHRLVMRTMSGERDPLPVDDSERTR